MKKVEFQAVVFANHGYSLHPLTQTIHKALMPIANKPIIHYVLQWLEDYGILGNFFLRLSHR